jgi:hypothetical protein
MKTYGEYDQIIDLARQEIDGTMDECVREEVLLTKRNSNVAHLVLKDEYCDKPTAVCRAISHRDDYLALSKTFLDEDKHIVTRKAERLCIDCLRKVPMPAVERLLNKQAIY